MVSIGFYGLACMIFLLVMGVPVTFALGTVAAVGLMLVAGLDSMLQQTIMVAMQTGTDFILLCIPLFVFMGKMVFHTGIARDLFTWRPAHLLRRHLRLLRRHHGVLVRLGGDHGRDPAPGAEALQV